MKERSLILALGLAGFVVMADNWVVSPILPAIARAIGVPAAKAGLLITAYMIPFGLFQLVFGPLADRFGKKQIVGLSMVLFTLGTGLCGLAMGMVDLALYRGLTGVFAASVMPISIALIADVVPMERRQAAIGTFMGIAFLGQGLSMAMGGAISHYMSWRGVFLTYAAFSVVSTALLLLVGRRAPSTKNPQSQFLKPYIRLLGESRSLSLYSVVVLEGILIIGSFSYLGALAEHRFHLSDLEIGLVLTGFGAGAVVTGRLVGKLVPRIGRSNAISLGLGAAALADLILFSGKGRVPGLTVGVLLLGVGFMLAHSTLLTLATEFARAARGTAMSLVAFCFMGSGGVGTAIGGKLIGSMGYETFYGLYGVALLALVILARKLMAVSPELEFLGRKAPHGPVAQPERG
jgi:predicted MFS family arabinose efflux permease